MENQKNNLRIMGKFAFPFFILFALSASLKTNAQNIVIEKSTIEHDTKIRPCLLVKLDPEPKTLKNAWIDFLKDEYGFKLKGMGWFSNKDLLYAEEVSIAKLSSKKMNFYTYVVEDENGSEMKVFASFGYDIYVDEVQYPTTFTAMEEMLNSFLKMYLPKYYTNIIDETSDKIEDINDEIKDLKDDIKDKSDDIVKLNRDIEDDKKSIEDNTKKLETAEIQLKGRQEKLERVKGELKKL